MADNLTVSEYLDEWLERQQTQLQPATWSSYRGTIERYVLPRLGDTPLHDLTKRDVEQLYTRLFLRGGAGGRPLAKRTVAYTHSILHKALEDAVRDDLLARNPAHRARLPKIDQSGHDDGTVVNAWDAAQLRTFLAAIAEHRHRNLFVLAAFTGLRRGELCGLRWCDVHLDRRLLQVRRSLTIDRRHIRLKEPKTSRARSLHLDDTAVDALRRQQEWQRERRAALGPGWHNQWDLVFTADTGRPLVPDTISRIFREIVVSLPIPTVRLHDVRHCHATLMLQAGVPVKVVSERLGHASSQLTMDIYAHVLPAMDSDAAARFAKHVLDDAHGHGLADGCAPPAAVDGPAGGSPYDGG